jgi:hypothetical protein
LIYRHKTWVLVGVFDVDVFVDVATIVCWSRRCWGWKNSKRFWLDVKLKIRFVVGKFDWFGRKTWRVIWEGRSSDVGEKAMDWENWDARDDDGDKQLDEYDISIGADCKGRLSGSSN